MLLILQRYYFESESQPAKAIRVATLWCCLSYKDTILKANHNIIPEIIGSSTDVAYPTKILFWKRITTRSTMATPSAEMLLILQRYYFESESQPLTKYTLQSSGCCLSYKDTILKANHNYFSALAIWDEDVAYPTKILFWKRITTSPL